MPAANAALVNLYNFTNGIDGASPQPGLIQASNGAFYGAALNGGSNGFGTVFTFTTSGVLTPLYSFNDDVDGGVPQAGLTQFTNGNLFGATSDSVNGAGVIYRVTASGAFTAIYPFTGASDGSSPQASLTQGTNGFLYGTTFQGGANGAGTVFKVTATGALTTLYTFQGSVDGGAPEAALTIGPDGNFYGTTSSGGTNGEGTIFRITHAGQFNSLYSFTNGLDGAMPQVPLVKASDGNLYGAAFAGGANQNGSLFRVTTAGRVTAMYSFSAAPVGTNADGFNPSALIQASDGNLYGTTANGGANGSGTIFHATLAGAMSTLYSFGAISSDTFTNTDGANPTGIIQGRDGNFYCTTLAGGPDAEGSIFHFAGPAPLSFLGSQYANGQAVLRLTGQGNFAVDASTNLTQWAPLGTNTFVSNQIQVTDANARNFPHRFYRARQLP